MPARRPPLRVRRIETSDLLAISFLILCALAFYASIWGLSVALKALKP